MAFWKTALLAPTENLARRIGSLAYGYYTWVIFAVLLLTFGALALLAGRVQRARRLARFFSRWMFRLAGIPVSASGLEHLPAEPHVLLANHTSFLDAILLSALLPACPGYAFVTRRQFALQNLLWPFLISVRTLILKPHGALPHGGNVERMQSALQRGDNLIAFPEGTFSPEPGLKPFHSGVFIAAAQARVPIVVAELHGAREALRQGTWMPKRLPLALEIGTTLRPSGKDDDAIHALMLAARKEMMELDGESSSPGG